MMSKKANGIFKPNFEHRFSWMLNMKKMSETTKIFFVYV